MKRVSAGLLAIAALLCWTSCATAKQPALEPTAATRSASLWQEPTDLATRDVFNGPWGASRAPSPNATYSLVEFKHSGVNRGLTVVDPQGREWSVKQEFPGGLDSEGPVEVTLSRLLSAIGFHQPPVYFLPSFTLKDDWGTHIEDGGRFRLKEPTLKEKGEWRWEDNPFVNSTPYQGLLVLLMMFNDTDLKNSNNSLYEHKAGDGVEMWYAVRDIGAALGDTNSIAPLKNRPDAFERHPFILGVSNSYVDFAYNGLYRNLVRQRIRPEDVTWASNLLGQLRDEQWRDAFRAGGYEPEVASRFIRRLREKIEQGQELRR